MGLRKKKIFFGKRVGRKEKVATFALPILRDGDERKVDKVIHAAGGGRG